MAKGMRGRRRIASRRCSSRQTPYPLRSCDQVHSEKCSEVIKSKRDWEDATCSVCIEYPHNAVLLLCSSHEKGCRPYMCGTSFRFSNCLDQYKKASTKLTASHHGQPLHGPSIDDEKSEISAELVCPLCRGQVKGWTVVEPAREYLNAKKRSCMQDNCSFVGTYKELRRHVKTEHPAARPREVDPALEQNWRRLEREREHNDVISTIRSSMPGAMFLGDYVIEGGTHGGFDDTDEEEEGFDMDHLHGGGMELSSSNLVNVFLLLRALGPSSGNVGPNRGLRRHDTNSVDGSRRIAPVPVNGADSPDEVSDSDDDGGNDDGISLVGRLRRQGRVLLGRSGRRQRRREANGGEN